MFLRDSLVIMMCSLLCRNKIIAGLVRGSQTNMTEWNLSSNSPVYVRWLTIRK